MTLTMYITYTSTDGKEGIVYLITTLNCWILKNDLSGDIKPLVQKISFNQDPLPFSSSSIDRPYHQVKIKQYSQLLIFSHFGLKALRLPSILGTQSLFLSGIGCAGTYVSAECSWPPWLCEFTWRLVVWGGVSFWKSWQLRSPQVVSSPLVISAEVTFWHFNFWG